MMPIGITFFKEALLYFSLVLTLKAANMNCPVSAINAQVFSPSGSFSVTFTPITSCDTAYLKIPLQWNTLDNSRTIVSSNVNSLTQCTIQNVLCQITTNPISNLVTCPITTQSSSYAINCINIQNPSSTEPTGLLSLTTSLNHIAKDTCSSNLIISNWIPNQIMTASFDIQTDAGLEVSPNQAGHGIIAFTTVSDYYGNDLVQVSIQPKSGLTFPQSFAVTFMISGSIVNQQVVSSTATTIILNQTYNQPKKVPGTLFQISINMLEGPSTFLNSISIQTLRIRPSGNYLIDQYLSLTYQPPAAQLQLLSVSIDNTIISQAAQYTFVIQNTNPLSQSGSVSLLLPSVLSTSSNQLSCSMQINQNTPQTGICTLVTTIQGSTIYAQNLFNLNVLVNSALTLQINGIINAQSTDTQLQFTNLQTYYSSSLPYVVDSLSQTFSFNPYYTPGNIYNVMISSQSDQVGQKTGLVIVFTLNDTLNKNGYIIMSTPTDIQLNDGQTSCLIGQQQCIQSYIVGQNNAVRISGFINDLVGKVQQTITISNLIYNPLSIRPTKRFGLQTFQQNNVIVDQNLNIPGFYVNTPNQFTQVLVYQGSKQNGAVTFYTFQITLSSPSINNALLIINLPGQVIGNGNVCTSDQTVLQAQLSCYTTNTTQIIVTLNTLNNANIPQGQSFKINITNIQNHKSFAPSYPSLQLNDSIYAISSSISNSITVTNNICGLIQNPYISVQNGIYGQNDTYTLNFTSQNVMDSSCQFQISVPIQIPILKNTTLCAGGKFIGFQTTPDCSAVGQKITITSSNLIVSQNNYFLFQITSLQNPSQLISDAFVISTYDNNNYLMDNSTQSNLVFQPLCQLPCKTCAQDAHSECDSCYSNLQKITSSIYFKQDNNTCVQDCGSTYFQKSGSCIKCGSNCLSCLNETQCTQCASGFKKESGECVQTCPSNEYDDQGVCKKCSNNCLTCSGSSSNCVTCNSALRIPLFLQGSNCTNVCQYGYFGSILDGNCTKCEGRCLTCKSSTQCLTCVLGVPTYYSNFQCLDCPVGCAECTSSIDCTKCNSSQFLLGQKCLLDCPQGYTNNLSTNKCDLQIVKPSPSQTQQSKPTQTSQSTPTPQPSPSAVSSAVTVVQQNVTPSKYIPVPFLVLFFVAGLTVLVSKLHRHETFVPGAMLGLCSYLEWASWITLIYLYNKEKDVKINHIIPIYVGLAACYIMNIINIIFTKTKIYSDPEYIKWLSTPLTHYITAIIVFTFSVTTTFKASRIIYSKYFAFSFFKAKLSSTQPFFVFNLINGISILITTIPIAFGSALIAYNANQQDQLFISAIDAFVVTLLMMVFQLWETKKDENFFDEPSAQLYYSLNATKIEKAEDSGFFHKSFQKSVLEVKADNYDQEVHQGQDKQGGSSVKAENYEDIDLENNQVTNQINDQEINQISNWEIPLSSEKKNVIHSDHQSQVIIESAKGDKFEDLDIIQMQGSQVKSNSKHTIYFGQNASYKLTNVQPYDLRQDSPVQESLRNNKNSSRQQNTSQQNRATPSPDKNSLITQRIIEQHSEIDPDDEPQQPIHQKPIIERTLKNDQPNSGVVSQNYLNFKSNELQEDLSIQIEPMQGIQQIYNPPNNSDSQEYKTEGIIYNLNDTNEVDDINFSIKDQSIQVEPMNKMLHIQSFPNNYQSDDYKTKSIIYDMVDQDDSRLSIFEDEIKQVPKEDIVIRENPFDTVIKPQKDPKGQGTTNKNKLITNVQPRLLKTLNAREKVPKVKIVKNKSLSPPPSSRTTNQFQITNQFQQQKDERMKQIFDSNESIHTLSDANWGENQISPSDFNVLNQRYDEVITKVKPQGQTQKQVSTTMRSNDRNQIPDPTRAKSLQKKSQISPSNFSGDDYDLQMPPGPFRTTTPSRAYNNNTLIQLDDSSYKQLEQARLRDIEKIYLQRLENNLRTTSLYKKAAKSVNKKKIDPKHRQKDISDALFIDDDLDEDDIIF